jgi:hypothetical protein
MSTTINVSKPGQSVSVAVNKPGQSVSANLLQGTKKAGQTRIDSISGIAGVDVQSALEELNYRHFQATSAPSLGVTHGDIWSDLTNNKLKLYGGSEWLEIGMSAVNDLEDTTFKFTATPALTSGNVAEFKNNTTSVFKIQYDGVVVLKNQSSSPSAVADGLYSDGTDLYYGKQ